MRYSPFGFRWLLLGVFLLDWIREVDGLLGEASVHWGCCCYCYCIVGRKATKRVG